VHLPEVIRNSIQVIKQAWAAMAKGEQPLTPYVSKQQKKKDKHVTKSASYRSLSKLGQPWLKVSNRSHPVCRNNKRRKINT
jgi:hypothetical protein